MFLCDRPAPCSKKEQASIVPIEALTTPARKPSRQQLPDDFGRRKTPKSNRSLHSVIADTPRIPESRSQSAMSIRSTTMGKRAGTPAHEFLSRMDAGLPYNGILSVNNRTNGMDSDDMESVRFDEGNDTIGDISTIKRWGRHREERSKPSSDGRLTSQSMRSAS